jgi:DNA invertase Pin-like site-specific DNA recombinase
MVKAHEISVGFKKAVMERTSGTGTMEEMMAGEAAVITKSSKAIVGYRRVSSLDRALARQELEGAERIFEEKESGAKRDRPALSEMINYIRDGDTVIVHSIDHLARDLRDLQDIIEKINGKGASISFQTEGLTFKADKADPIATLQLQMIGAFAQFERAIIRKRQAEGIAKAKDRGVYKGRKQSIDAEKVRRLHAEGYGASEIARTMDVGRASVYRLLRASEGV